MLTNIARLLKDIYHIIRPARQLPSSESSGLPRRCQVNEDTIVFRKDGSLADLPVWHSRYLDRNVTTRQAELLERHLLTHRRDNAHWDALTLELERQVCERLLGHPVESVWAEELFEAPRITEPGCAQSIDPLDPQ